MIKRYLLNREEIFCILNKEKKTINGNIWYPKMLDLMNLNGYEDDKDYFYDRNYFKFKMYMTEDELKAFMSKKKINEFDEDEMYDISVRFHETNKELKNIKDKDEIVYPYEYNIEELIDTFVDLYNFIN